MTKIGDGKNYDTTKLAKDGVTQEEFQKQIKNDPKLINIYKSFDTDKNGTLSKDELANALGAYKSMDSNNDGDLSGKELENFAQMYNQNEANEKVTGKNLKSFLKNLVNSMTGKESVTTESVLDEQKNKSAQKIQLPEQQEVQQAAKQNQPDLSKLKVDDSELKPQENNQTYTYTVQEGDKYTDVIKKSLAAKGIENATDDQVQEEMKRFEEANPNAVRTSKKGVKFLNVGDKVKMEGQLKNLENTDLQNAIYKAKYGKADKTKANKNIDTPMEGGGKKTESYDENGRLSSYEEFDKNNKRTKAVFFARDEKGNVIEPMELTYEHDKDGNNTKKVNIIKDAQGNVTSSSEATYEYDKDGHTTKGVSIIKDAQGNVTSSSEATYEYDKDGNNTKKVTIYKDAQGNVTSSSEATYEYDKDGNITKVVYIYKDAKKKEISFDDWVKL